MRMRMLHLKTPSLLFYAKAACKEVQDAKEKRCKRKRAGSPQEGPSLESKPAAPAH